MRVKNITSCFSAPLGKKAFITGKLEAVNASADQQLIRMLLAV